MRNKIPYKSKYTNHHKLPRSRWWNSNKDNIEMIKKSTHTWFHMVFMNQLPHEQYKTLDELNRSTYTEEARQLVNEFREKAMDLIKSKNYYKNSCYKHLKT